jgi:hypothetical protein
LGYYRKTRLWKVVSRETGIMSGVVWADLWKGNSGSGMRRGRYQIGAVT